ncbi:hypothetical protein CLOM_g3964 [Closterium sp. NIES-68]|nr:hypothetical protein CLOM_g3964 [Closterium sp. NIES-68]GJP83188.1 hypothetical protein CLOP_g13376 [Closterium sp. NIES-67]
MGHRASTTGRHHSSLHHHRFHQDPTQYNHNRYSHDNGYNHDHEVQRQVSSLQRQQQEEESQPPPFFAAVAAAAASGKPALLNLSLKPPAAAESTRSAAAESTGPTESNAMTSARAEAAAVADPAATVADTTGATAGATAAGVAATAPIDTTFATTGATAATAATTGDAGDAGIRRAVIIGPVSLKSAATAVTATGIHASKKRSKAKKRPKGPCTSLKKVFIINVTSAADFKARTALPPTTTVILNLQTDLALPTGVVFQGQFSCTILMSAKWPGYTITGGNPMYPALRVWNTNNFVSMNVNYHVPVSESSPACASVPELGKNDSCPAISVYKSYGVQIGKGAIFGRIDVLRSMDVRLDSLKVTGVSTPLYSPGVIRVALSGYGPALLRSGIVISNNEVYGVNTPIVLHRGAIGVTVANNYIHDFIFAGVRCGVDVHYSGDCMLTRVNSNLIVATGRNMNGDHDAAGIYFCSHWFSPGNSALCNYIYNGDHCYYIDYCASGVLVRGGACVNTYDGMKVNNGKWNIIKDVAMKGTVGSLGWTSCFTVTVNNCLKDPGNYWEAMRVKYYNSDRINKLWPWMQNVCKETSANGGVPCNPPNGPGADITGACSGLGTDNIIDVIAVNTTEYGLDNKHCENFPITAELNHQTNLTLRDPLSAGFLNYQGNDLGLNNDSLIYKYRPDYLSCPLGLVGPRRFSAKYFFDRYNTPMPGGFRKVVMMDMKHIFDRDLITALAKVGGVGKRISLIPLLFLAFLLSVLIL